MVRCSSVVVGGWVGEVVCGWLPTYLPYGTKACMRPSFEGSRAVVMNGEGLCGEDKISTTNAMPCDAMR